MIALKEMEHKSLKNDAFNFNPLINPINLNNGIVIDEKHINQNGLEHRGKF